MSEYYPEGAEFDSSAPYNEETLKEKEIAVTVSITLSKTLSIKVDDYTIIDKGVDEDGCYYEDVYYPDYDFESAVKSQHILPYQVGEILQGFVNTKIGQDLDGWNVDDFEVIPEE